MEAIEQELLTLPLELIDMILERLPYDKLKELCRSEEYKEICNRKFVQDLLIKRKSEEIIQQSNQDLNLAIEQAFQLNRKDVIDYILNLSNNFSDVILYWIILYNDIETLKKAIPKVPTLQKITLIFEVATFKGNIESIKLIIENYQSQISSEQYDTLVEIAIKYGQTELVKELFPYSTQNKNFINLASEYNHTPSVKYLLNYLDPTLNSNVAIHSAYLNKNWKIVKLLLFDDQVFFSLSNERLKMYLSWLDIYSLVAILEHYKFEYTITEKSDLIEQIISKRFE